MLFESAFYKLPELMMSNIHNRGRVEAMIVQYMANALQMELACRSIPFAYNHVIVEKPYPKQVNAGPILRADLHFDSQGTIPSTCNLSIYGFKSKQWLEAKTFFSARNRNSSQPKTQNLGRIVKDIIRLCLLPEELQGRIRQNGRYLLLVFDKQPSEYLPISRREWACDFFKKESGEVTINLSSEKKSLIQSIINSETLPSILKIRIKKISFEPCQNNISPVYWGYLYRIGAWSISIDGKKISSNGKADEEWSTKKLEQLEQVRANFLRLINKDEV